MNTEDERLQAFNICKEYLSKKIDAFIASYESNPESPQSPSDLAESRDFIEVLSVHVVPYAILTNDLYDIKVIEFMLKFWEACTIKQFHLYHIMRYLNDFKYQAKGLEEDQALQELVKKVEEKQLEYLLQQIKSQKLDTLNELESELSTVESQEL